MAVWKPLFMKSGAKGGGKGRSSPLDNIDASCKVWIGGVAEGTEWKALQDHMDTSGKTRWVEVMRKGVACAAYKTAADATAAIAALNGSTLNGATLEVDTWNEKSPGKRAGKGGAKGGQGWLWVPHGMDPMMAMMMSGGKGGKGGKGKRNDRDKLSKFEASCKVWIGNLGSGVTWKELQAHADTAGKAKWVSVLPKGSGCVVYATAEEATSAIAALDGTELGGQAIQADVWTKKEKTEKAT